MRSPALVVSLVAVSALSPAVVFATPLPGNADRTALADRHKYNAPAARRGLGFLNEVFARAEPTRPAHGAAPTSKPKVATLAGYPVGGGSFPMNRREFWKKDGTHFAQHAASNKADAGDEQSDRDVSAPSVKAPPAPGTNPRTDKKQDDDSATGLLLKRLDDALTTGGNAHSGTAGAVDGGSVDSGDNGGMPTLMNMNSNNAGSGGGSESGCAAGGKGATGGNASSGDSGSARGGRVRGSGGMVNVDSNNAGSAGESSSGCAEAGYSEGAGVNSQGTEKVPTS